ncbi:glycosyltransferase family 1 protein [Lactobacillus amylovorus]|nr:glycosyltransferase family 1 protein [Lactobacillus amylovorus]MDB6254893.1 glycosyltransferase family 1 protein [Lactobacillus amylovorus]
MKKTYKILVFGMTSNPGGVESFLMNYYRKLDRNKFHLDFLCNTHGKIAYEDEIKSLGGKIFKVSARSKHPIKYSIEINSFFKKNAKNYDCIWVNLNSLANIDYLKLAKKYGIHCRIIHSHNSANMDNKLRGLLHNWNKRKIGKYATNYWAASKEAGLWFYSSLKSSKVEIIKNAIDVDNFAFNREDRNNIRQNNSLTGFIVLGNIGRLHFQKNQSFAIDILDNLVKKNPNYKLVLVGQGEDREKLIQKTKVLHLESNVLFTGAQTNINSWLSAFDIFIFPSIFEGLGIAGLEAEANGLPVFASKSVIPSELKINSNFQFVSLKKNAKYWADLIAEQSINNRLSQEKILNNFINSGFDINNAVIFLEKKLESAIENNS